MCAKVVPGFGNKQALEMELFRNFPAWILKMGCKSHAMLCIMSVNAKNNSVFSSPQSGATRGRCWPHGAACSALCAEFVSVVSLHSCPNRTPQTLTRLNLSLPSYPVCSLLEDFFFQERRELLPWEYLLFILWFVWIKDYRCLVPFSWTKYLSP